MPLSQDFKLRNQLTSAAVSIMSNIAEGFARYHHREFVRFLDIAQSSAAELKSLLYVVADLGAASDEVVGDLQRECERCQRLILGLIRYLAKAHPAI